MLTKPIFFAASSLFIKYGLPLHFYLSFFLSIQEFGKEALMILSFSREANQFG